MLRNRWPYLPDPPSIPISNGASVGRSNGIRTVRRNLNEGSLVIRNTKFHKTRLVPIGADLTRVCFEYRRLRAIAKGPLSTKFFLTTKGGADQDVYRGVELPPP